MDRENHIGSAVYDEIYTMQQRLYLRFPKALDAFKVHNSKLSNKKRTTFVSFDQRKLLWLTRVKAKSNCKYFSEKVLPSISHLNLLNVSSDPLSRVSFISIISQRNSTSPETLPSSIENPSRSSWNYEANEMPW